MGVAVIIEVNIDSEELKKIYIKMVEERLAELESEVFFMDSAQLQKFVGMSWNSIVTHLLSDPNYPSLKLGNRWLFPRREVEKYMQKYYEMIRDSKDRNIITFKRK